VLPYSKVTEIAGDSNALKEASGKSCHEDEPECRKLSRFYWTMVAKWLGFRYIAEVSGVTEL